MPTRQEGYPERYTEQHSHNHTDEHADEQTDPKPVRDLSDYQLKQATNMLVDTVMEHQNKPLATELRALTGTDSHQTGHKQEHPWLDQPDPKETIADLRYAFNDASLGMDDHQKLQFAAHYTQMLTGAATHRLDTIQASYQEALDDVPELPFLKEITGAFREKTDLAQGANDRIALAFCARDESLMVWPGTHHPSETERAASMAEDFHTISQLSEHAVTDAALDAIHRFDRATAGHSHHQRLEACSQFPEALLYPAVRDIQSLRDMTTSPITAYSEHLLTQADNHPHAKAISQMENSCRNNKNNIIIEATSEVSDWKTQLVKRFQDNEDPVERVIQAVDQVEHLHKYIETYFSNTAEGCFLEDAFEDLNYQQSTEYRRDTANTFAHALAWPTEQAISEFTGQAGSAQHYQDRGISEPEIYQSMVATVAEDTTHRVQAIKQELANTMYPRHHDDDPIIEAQADLEQAKAALRHMAETGEPPAEFTSPLLENRFAALDHSRTSGLMESLDTFLQQQYPESTPSYSDLINKREHHPTLDRFLKQHPLSDHTRITGRMLDKAGA